MNVYAFTTWASHFAFVSLSVHMDPKEIKFLNLRIAIFCFTFIETSITFYLQNTMHEISLKTVMALVLDYVVPVYKMFWVLIFFSTFAPLIDWYANDRYSLASTYMYMLFSGVILSKRC